MSSLKQTGEFIKRLKSGNLEDLKGISVDFKTLTDKQQNLILGNTKLDLAQRKGLAKAVNKDIAEDGSIIAATVATKAKTQADLENAAAQKVREEATEEVNKENLKQVTTSGAAAAGTTGQAVSATGAAAANTTLAASFEALWATMKPVLAAIATSPLTWMIALGAAAVALDDFLHVDYGEAHEAMDEAQSKYDETTSSLEDLRSEAETTASRIKELEELQASDGLSLVEENELNTLKAQNAELERQIKLKEELQEAQGKQLADAAKEAMGKGDRSVAQSVAMGDETGESNFKGEVKDTTDQQEVQDSIALIEQYKSKVDTINESIADTEMKIAKEKNYFVKKSLERSLKSQQDELKHYETSIDTLYSNIDTRAASMQKNLDALKLDPEVNAEEIKELEDALFAIETIDLDDVGKAFKQVEDYFDGSLTSSTLKQKLIQMLNDTENGSIDASEALSRLGLTLEDLGIEGEEGKRIFNDYFDEFRSDAEKAQKAANAVEGSLASIQDAGASENQDKNWNTVTELYEAAKELDKKKKWGTDDFQEMAQFIAPEDAKLDITKGDIKADDYKKLWDKYYKNFAKYFDSENPLKAAQNAQSKLISEGLAKKDADGIIRFTEAFRTSADAADAWGVSVEAAEVIMDNLESHGYEFTYEEVDPKTGEKITKDMFRAGEALSDYESALSGMQSVYAELDDDNPFKEKLGEAIEKAEGNLELFNEDITKLENETIVKEIQFEYNLAQLKLDLQNIIAGSTGGIDDIAAIVETKKKINDLILQQEGNEGLSLEYDYQVAQAAIDNITNTLMTSENLSENQRKSLKNMQSAIYDVLISYGELHAAGKVNTWDDFLKTDEYTALLNKIKTETGKSEEEILSMLEEVENSDFFKDSYTKKEVEVTTTEKTKKEDSSETQKTPSISQKNITSVLDPEHLSNKTPKKEVDVSNVLAPKYQLELPKKKDLPLPEEFDTFEIELDLNSEETEKDLDLLKNEYETFKIKTKVDNSEVNINNNVNYTSKGSNKVQNDSGKVENSVNAVDRNPVVNFETDGVAKTTKEATSVAQAVTNVPPSKSIKFTANGIQSAITAIGRLLSKIKEVDNHDNVTVTTRAGGGAGQAKGTAHSSGFAHARGINNKIPEDALTNSDYRTTDDNVALTGELGREIIVDTDNDTWYTVGDDGAEFTNVPKNAIIFNHKQTEELLGKGKTKSRGKLHAKGTAFAGGTAYGGGLDLGGGRTSSSSASKNATKSTSSKTTKAAEKALDAISKWFDWIAVRLDRLARDSQNAEKAIERAVGLSKTLTATNKAITAVNKEQEAAEKGAKRYLKAAQTVAKNTGLSASLQKKVQNGTIDITKYSETTQKKIQEYQNYYEKYLDCLDQVADLEDQAIELALSRLDKINEYYEAVNSVHESLIDTNDAKLDYREAMGYSAVSSSQKELLQSSVEEAEAIKKNAYSNYTKYQDEFNTLVKNGTLKKDSVEYNDRLSELNNLKAAYYEASTAVIEHADALREIKYTKLNNAIDKFARASEKIQNQIELSESRNETVSESEYKRQMTENNNQISKKYELRQEKLAEQSRYAVNSERYQELADEISGIDSDIVGLLVDNEKLKDSIVESRYKPLTDSVESLQNVRSEYEDFMSLMNEEAFFDSKTGELTDDGIANIYLIEQSMNSAKQEIAEYTKGLEKLEQDFANGNISQEEFNESSAEYREGIRNATKDVKSYADTLSDLYITQMEKENELLKEVIDKRKEALKRKADYYNYDKTLRNQTKDLNLLKAQAAALEGSNDAASKAELKRLRQEIADAEEELADTKRNHSIEMQESGYDNLSQDLDDILADTELEIKTNADKQLSVIDEMLQKTVDKYSDAYSKINEIISKTGFVGSDEFNQGVENIETSQGATEQKDFATENQSNISSTTPVSDIETGDITSNKVDNKHKEIENALNEPEQVTNRTVAAITPSKTSVSIQEGKSTTITCTVLPSDAANRKLQWKSSNTKVATVSGGKITGKKAGTCTVTATATDGSGVNASISVKVTAAPKADPPKTKVPAHTTPTNNKTTNSTSSTDSGGNGKITKGEKVTFASGKYTASSDGSGSSGKQKLGKSVYIAKIKSGAKRPYLLSTDKAGKKLLGWVSKGQLKGYASGTKYVSEDQFAWTQENGSEIVTLPDGSVLTKLPRGSGVIPNNLTENLWGLASAADDIMANTVGNTMRYINNVVNSGGNNITYHYDSLLHVEGNVDREALPELKQILEQSYKYTSEMMYKDAVKLGFRKR